MTPDVKLAERQAVAGQELKYTIGQKVLACFSIAAADWAKAEVIGVVEHAPVVTAPADPKAAAKAAKAAAKAAAEEAQAMADLAETAALEADEIAVAEGRQREHVMAMAKAAAIRRELSNRGGGRELKPVRGHSVGIWLDKGRGL